MGDRFRLITQNIDGLLQAQVNNDIVYVSSDGQYLVQGTMFDIDTRTNVTDQAKAGIRRELIKDLDWSRQISFSPESPQYELLVFTDIDCGYCRKLHEEIDKLGHPELVYTTGEIDADLHDALRQGCEQL